MTPQPKSTQSPGADHAGCRSCNARKWAVAVVVVAVVATLFTVFDVRGLLRDALEAVEQLGAWGPALFVVIYVLACVLLIPGSVLTLGAGALFGVVWGTVYVSLASTLGATAAFLVGRYLARRWVARKIAGNAAFAAIDQAVAEEGWKIVGLTRLSPVFPFTLLNYAFGVTRVKLRDYVLASWIGMMPGTVMYVYLGSLARAGAGGQQKSPAEWALYGVGLLATIAVTVVITRIARQALARRTNVSIS
ncbi:MAG: TVP38/TMEM64 family protein [Verrucomicrobia bacterium]|nr:TVP38/TMEM64 family protein [Verrucomicrobiota bacterium]